MITQFHTERAERYLLAYVYGYLGEHDPLKVRSDAEKSFLLAALNFSECIAAAASRWHGWTLTQ